MQRKKDEMTGKYDEAMSWALQQRQSKVDSVKRTEARWKDKTTTEHDEFLMTARANKAKTERMREQMRQTRKDLVRKHNTAARTERSLPKAKRAPASCSRVLFLCPGGTILGLKKKSF